jgi:myosin heavy subunit
MTNPEMPGWIETENGLEYDPWPSEMEYHLTTLSRELTDPLREGMFDRADRPRILQKFMDGEEVDTDVKAAWERLLICYDIAMGGKHAALVALVEAQRRIHEQEGIAVGMREAMRELSEKNKDLNRWMEQLESDNWGHQQRIEALEQQNQTYAAAAAALEAKCSEYATALQAQLEVLEDMVAEWGPQAGPATSRSPTRDRADHDARFQSIRDALENARAAATISNARFLQVLDRCATLEQSVEEAKKQTEPHAQAPGGDPGLQLRVRELELQKQALETQLEAERGHSVKREEEYARLTALLTGESETHSLPYQVENGTANQTAWYSQINAQRLSGWLTNSSGSLLSRLWRLPMIGRDTRTASTASRVP